MNTPIFDVLVRERLSCPVCNGQGQAVCHCRPEPDLTQLVVPPLHGRDERAVG